ncbi:protein NRT1/ PTR FAMILY 7.3-like [Amaranthus tricolor]|uniref:protein NRT1/ PTR FAMILY 7.3-like n=1 Tax=Amaranthus tricolor TaxID=29722 RepID=UPI002583B58C|nr:protein NRT1/ PTR FAMILY 7.3-like [Amaranthus tricolor]
MVSKASVTEEKREDLEGKDFDRKYRQIALFLGGTPRYRHFKTQGNPVMRFCKVFVAAFRKWNFKVLPNAEDLYELDAHTYSKTGRRMISHTKGLMFLDKAATISIISDYDERNLCTVTQVEEVKCILRLLPIWICTIMYSVVFTQMASLFVEQGAAMNTTIGRFHISPASMSVFDIISVVSFIIIYRRVISPFIIRLRNKDLTELQRMGIGLILAISAMVTAGTVEIFRLKYAKGYYKNFENASSLSIFWQVPQYMLIGASEVFMYVGQLEFFNGQAPDGLKTFGSALCMLSMSFGNYTSSVIVTMIMKITTRNNMPGWIPENLNEGHLERFFFLLAALTAVDFMVYMFYASSYKYIQPEESKEANNAKNEENMEV